jgi:hypothetical protein
MASVTVTTSEELKKAQDANVDEIVVVGALAEKLRKARKVTTLGVVALAALAGIAATAIPTGGASTLGFIPVATLTGMEIATILFVITIGITTVIALFRDYEAEFDANGAKFKKRR